jgi:hypothetical protein
VLPIVWDDTGSGEPYLDLEKEAMAVLSRE